MLAIAFPASAAATIPHLSLGPAFSFADAQGFLSPVLVSDGERYVAFVPVRGTVRVRDTRTGRSRDLKAPCHSVGPSAAGVLLVGVSAANVLLACVNGDGVTRDAVLDARTLAVRKLPLLRGLGYVATVDTGRAPCASSIARPFRRAADFR